MNTPKFVTDLSKGILGVPDNAEMWMNIINHIPTKHFFKEDLKILVPCAGYGTEADLLVKHMLNLGIRIESVLNSIYFLDRYNTFTNRAQRKGYMNIVTREFLSWETDMKFDVIIGNPPYQGGEKHGLKIWPMFTTKALSLLNKDGYLGWVIPSGWLESNNALMKKVRTALTTNYDLKIINRKANDYFDVGQDILYLVAENKKYQGKTTYISDTIEEVFDLRDGLTKGSEELMIESILNRVIDSDDPRIKFQSEHLPSDDVSKEETDEYKYPIIYSTANKGYTKTKLKNEGQLKLALNLSSSYFNEKAEDKNMPITTTAVGALMYYIPLKNENDGILYRNYLSSKLMRFLAKYYRRKNTGFVHAVRQEKLPDLELRDWTDQDLYKYFNLSKEEIEFVENDIK